MFSAMEGMVDARTDEQKRQREFLAAIASNIWLVEAKSRKFKLWLSELNRILKGIDRNLKYQEENLIKSIKRGFVDEQALNESNDSIDKYRCDAQEWLKQMLRWADDGEIEIEQPKVEQPEEDDVPPIVEEKVEVEAKPKAKKGKK